MFAMLIAAMLCHGVQIPAGIPAEAARQPTDAQILGEIGEMNANEIEAAKLALQKGSGGAVHGYAKMIVDDHQDSEHELLEMSKTLHIAPQVPADSTARHTHATVMAQLNLASGAAFDKAFMQYSLADHEAMLDNMRKSLLPNAHGAEVRGFLTRMLRVLQRHDSIAQAWVKKNQ